MMGVDDQGVHLDHQLALAEFVKANFIIRL
jgi:hypothetical protein